MDDGQDDPPLKKQRSLPLSLPPAPRSIHLLRSTYYSQEGESLSDAETPSPGDTSAAPSIGSPHQMTTTTASSHDEGGTAPLSVVGSPTEEPPLEVIFKTLSAEKQRAALESISEECLERIAADPANNNLVYIKDMKTPTDSITIDRIDPLDITKGYKMVAARDFQKGDVIFRNESLIFPEHMNIVMNVNGGRLWLDKLYHTVNVGQGLRQCYTFDTFQNHSCDPNTAMPEATEGDLLPDSIYELVAIKDIKKGTELTCDYETFDRALDGTVFHCQCGSANCRGVVHG